MTARWLLPTPTPDVCADLSRELQVSPITAQVLVNRGFRDAASARAFMNPQLNDLADPGLLPGMEAAVERLFRAAGDNERILIYGDYDVDGASATALLVKLFRLAGLDVESYVPHRIEEGYGLNTAAMDEFKRRGISLVVTVDCGVSAVAEAEHARAHGIDLVITDHHEPGERVAAACAVVNPKLTGSPYPFRDLSGVGVAFKLAWAVADRFSAGEKMSDAFRQFLLESMGLVALGTIADVVPLLGENRIFVRYGLRALEASPSPGVQALIDSARVRRAPAGRGALRPGDVAFGLAPRLNAAGRMADAGLAIELLTTEDSSRAREIADRLDRHNTDRQKLQRDAVQHAREMALGQPDFESSRCLVLAHDSWHPGVIGIVASKLAEEFCRPTALIAIEGAVGKGSARSVPGFHLFRALEGFRDRMIRFGGHEAAAGFELAVDHIPALREHLDRVAAETDPELFRASIQVDADVQLTDLSERLISELEALAPYGRGNRRPLFAARGLRVAGRPRLMGMKGQHVSFHVSDGKVGHRAVAFRMGEQLYDKILAGAKACSLVFSPRIDTWNRSGALELHVKDMAFE